jgi:hypothetical protein
MLGGAWEDHEKSQDRCQGRHSNRMLPDNDPRALHLSQPARCQWPNRDSNPRPSSFLHSASTNYATACPWLPNKGCKNGERSEYFYNEVPLLLNIIIIYKQFCDELIACFSFTAYLVLDTTWIVCIRCRRNMFTKPLHSNDTNAHNKTQQDDLTRLLPFFQNTKSRLKMAHLNIARINLWRHFQTETLQPSRYVTLNFPFHIIKQRLPPIKKNQLTF